MTEAEPTEETWLFAGTRVGKTGKRLHAWLPMPTTDPDNPDLNKADLDRVLLFAPTGSPAVGSEYTVTVTREPEGVYMHGRPVRRGRHPDDALRALAEARHRAAETVLRRTQLERADKRASALDAALEPLIRISGELRPTDRDALLAYVVRKITRPWSGRS